MRHRSVVAALTVCIVAIGAFPAGGQRPTRTPLPVPVGPRPTYPGVYVKEIPAVPPVIEQAATSVVAFIGATPTGPIDTPTMVTSFAEYAAQFGGLDPASPVSFAVRLFFDNDGTRAWIVRSDLTSTLNLGGGATALTSALQALDAVEPVNILCLPEVGDEVLLATAEGWCSRHRAFLLIDPPADAATPAAVEAWLSSPDAPPRKRDCATYFPWLRVLVGGNSTGLRDCGPCGAVAGVIARTDAKRGVWKAPAGTDANLRGVTSLTHTLTNAETAQLNAQGVNSLRTMPATGTVVWGARTLSSDPEWRYVPVRRFTLMLEESIDAGTEWAVFEPNAEPLWLRLHASVDAFMQELWRKGALQGVKAEEAYFVQCGLGTTMTAGDVAAGRVIVTVGFAPMRPAEFVVLTFTKQTATP